MERQTRFGCCCCCCKSQQEPRGLRSRRRRFVRVCPSPSSSHCQASRRFLVVVVIVWQAAATRKEILQFGGSRRGDCRSVLGVGRLPSLRYRQSRIRTSRSLGQQSSRGSGSADVWMEPTATGRPDSNLLWRLSISLARLSSQSPRLVLALPRSRRLLLSRRSDPTRTGLRRDGLVKAMRRVSSRTSRPIDGRCA